MSLAPGTRLGSFEVLAPIGAGGMGEVYRARDSRLGRDVAVKVLPAAFATDRERLRRFEVEARAAGALNHPNILAVHELGTHDGAPFVVCELLEGETLRERLRAGPMPPRKAAGVGAQVARGLAAAHDKGIVHRDLKPENLFITREGRAKILDFGLAKLAGTDQVRGGLSGLPTTPPATGPGVILGTVGYMSPEQVRGRPSDHRSDIFSFGVILYEMISGRRAFHRDTDVETMSAILKEDPPEIPRGNGGVPPTLARIVEHCLEKNPEERFQSARDLTFDLEHLSGTTGPGAVAESGETGRPGGPARRRAAALLVLGFAAGALAGAAGAFRLARPAAIDPPSLHPLTYSSGDQEPSTSPDGRFIAFTSGRDGTSRIWLKQLAGGDEAALTSGPRDNAPRFSPDGTAILFARGVLGGRALYRVPVVGGEPRKTLEDAQDGDWSPDGRQIAFIRIGQEKGMTRYALGVADVDGRNERTLLLVENQRLLNPRFSPDGRTVAVIQTGVQNVAQEILLVPADGSSPRLLKTPAPHGQISSVVWSGGDGLVFAMSDSAIATFQRGTASRLVREEIGPGRVTSLMNLPSAVPVLDVIGPGNVVVESFSSRQNLEEFSLLQGGVVGEGRWLSRGMSNDRQPTYSRDGEWILFSSTRAGSLDLWMVSTRSRAIRRITDDPADDWDPAFMPDGKSLIWSSNRSGHFEIWISTVDGTGARQVTNDGVDAENPTATADGRWIVYASTNPAHSGVWKIRPDGSDATRLVAATVLIPEVSPDGSVASYITGISGPPDTLKFVRVEEGTDVPFSIRVPRGDLLGRAWGRSRWMPDGRRIAFVAEGENGSSGVYVQDFVPGRDTTSTRHHLAGFDRENQTDSFGISPDGSRIALAVGAATNTLMLADHLPGVEPPRRTPRSAAP
jgi:eukaryotic-like serine/threonine-protein kinase